MQQNKERFYWVDVAKAIGIFLIFYAHLLQRTYRLSTDEIFFQYKVIYSFHLPLFFFISGFFYKNRDMPKLRQIGILFQKRIFPVFLFVVLTFAFSVPYQYLKFAELDASYYLDNLFYLIQGKPHLSATLWFLVCLWVVEIWAVMILPGVRTTFQGILLSAFFLYFGYLWTAVPELEPFYLLPKNFWYLHESLIAFGFYLAGFVSFKLIKKIIEAGFLTRLALIFIFSGVIYGSVRLNNPSDDFVVVMKASEHGNFFFFPAAFAGIFTVILIASIVPRMKWIDYIGRNTLILLCTNGLFMSFFNSHIVAWLQHYESTAWVTFDSFWVSIFTIGLSVPVIELLNRWLPQLVGYPQQAGPLLNAIKPLEFEYLRNFFLNLSEKLGAIR